MNKVTLFVFDILKKRNTSVFLTRFNKSASLSKHELREYQFEKLKKLLIQAGESVPFYQRRFEEINFDPKTITSFDQIRKIPPLTRSDLYNNWKDIISERVNAQKLSKGSSSGSTGMSVTYFKDSKASSAGQAAHLIGWQLSGWKMNMKGLHIWGNPSTVNNEWKRLSSKLKAKMFSYHKFPAYKLTDGRQFQELHNKINLHGYDYIDGYTNAIYLYADYLKQNKLKINKPIKFVFTTAENLLQHQRTIIEEMIGPVYDSYGCSEINGIAYECQECKKYHIMDPHVYVEFGNKIDEIGSYELLITDLDNYSFPLIRYKNDDMGIPLYNSEPDCSRNFSRIQTISGRISDIIKLKNGGTLSVPSFFGSMLLKKINGLKQYQIEKIKDDLIHINLVISDKFSEKDKDIIDKSLKEYIQGKIRYEIKFLDEIEQMKTGKFKLLIDRTIKE